MIVIPSSGYPLSWPPGVPRTVDRSEPGFHTPVRLPSGALERRRKAMSEAIDKVVGELRRLDVYTSVISTNIHQRSDGLPYSDGPQQPKGDPGVAVYWAIKRRGQLVPYCMPCDRWARVADNLYAVGMSIEAMRGMDRWGCVTVEQAFAGFAALPPGTGEHGATARRPWREVLGDVWPGELEADEILALARSRHRKLVAVAHPDHGGDAARAAELNVALEEAERELGASNA